MSSYPPTPQFGVFNFVPQLPQKPTIAVPVPQQPPPSGSLASPMSNNASGQPGHGPVMPVKSKTSCILPPKPKAAIGGESSDSMEEGELSEAEEPDSNSARTRDCDSNNGIQQPELESKVDVPASPHNNNCDRNPKHRPKLNIPGAPRAPPSKPQSRARSRKNEKSGGALERGFNPPSYPRGMIEDREKQVYRRASVPRNGNAFPIGSKNGISPSNRPATIHKAANSNGTGRARLGNSEPDRSLLRQAQMALRDMDTCKVSFNDLLQETGLSHGSLRTLFIGAGLPVPAESSDASPAIQSQQESDVQHASQAIVKPAPREVTAENVGLETHAQRLRKQLEKEVRDKERKEAEAKAAELSRQREAAKEEQERQRRSVEVEAAREAFRKKMETLNLKKPATPSVPPTPISSTPVLAAIAQSRFSQLPSIPSAPKIPGLLLSQQSLSVTETHSPSNLSHGADVLMKDAPIVSPHLELSRSTSTELMAESNGIPQADKSTARRKRPVASDLYSDQNPSPMKRRFGAQRSSSVIIQISDDEESESDSDQLGYSSKETGSPRAAPPTISTINGNANNTNGLRRLQALSSSGTPTNSDQVVALRKKEAEIIRLKEQIMAAQQKKKLMKNGLSNAPTPAATPPVGIGPTVPPPSGAAKPTLIKPDKVDNGGGVLSNGSRLGVNKPDIISEESAKNEQEIREVEQLRQEKLQDLLHEAEQIAKAELQKKQFEAEKAQAQKEKERQEKKRQLMEVDSGWEQKRLVIENLKAEMEKYQREQQEMEKKKEALAKELEELEKVQQMSSIAQDESSNSPGSSTPQADLNDNSKDHFVNDKNSKPISAPTQKSRDAPPSVRTVDTESPQLKPSLPVRADEDVSMTDVHSGCGSEHHEPHSDADKLPTVVNAVSEIQSTSDEMDVESQPKSNADQDADEDVDMKSSSEEEESSEDSSEDESSDSDSDSDSDPLPNEPVSKVDSIPKAVPTDLSTEADPTPQKKISPVPVPSSESTNSDAPNTVSENQTEVKLATTKDKSTSVPNSFEPYSSPLSIFKSFRYHPHLLEFCPAGVRSLMYSNRLDPFKQMCLYEVNGGVCNDSSCEAQHFRDIAISDDQILVEMANTSEGTTPEETSSYSAGLRNTIVQMKQQGIMDFDTVVKGIARYRREFLGDETRIIKLPA
ncbi:hypothetical protein EDC01DRAFT_656420 [Geopyxis carbonaria]|nr:hypothetical protein EDC01DRAFT_656420 [Geopyxis carbonaria]